jgi:hypothetical protein
MKNLTAVAVNLIEKIVGGVLSGISAGGKGLFVV